MTNKELESRAAVTCPSVEACCPCSEAISRCSSRGACALLQAPAGNGKTLAYVLAALRVIRKLQERRRKSLWWRHA